MAKRYVEKKKNKKNGNGETIGLALIISSALVLLFLIIPIIFSTFGYIVRGVILGVIGISAYPLFIGILLLGVALYKDLQLKLSLKSRVCIGIISVCIIMILQLATSFMYTGNGFSHYIAEVWNAKWTGGGVVFGIFAYGLRALVGDVFAYIFMSLGVLIPALIMAEVPKKLGLSKKAKKEKEKEEPSEPERAATKERQTRTIVPVDKGLFNGTVTSGSGNYGTTSGKSSDLPVGGYQSRELYDGEKNRGYENIKQRETEQSRGEIERVKTDFSESASEINREKARQQLFTGERGKLPTGGYISPFPPDTDRTRTSDVVVPEPIISEPTITPILRQPSSPVVSPLPPIIIHSDSPQPRIEVHTPPPKDVSDRIVGGRIDDGEEISQRLAEEAAQKEQFRAGKFDNTKVQPPTFRPIEKPQPQPPTQRPIINGDYFAQKPVAGDTGERRPENNAATENRNNNDGFARNPIINSSNPMSEKPPIIFVPEISSDSEPARPSDNIAPIINGEDGFARKSDLEELIAGEKELAGRSENISEADTFETDDANAADDETSFNGSYDDDSFGNKSPFEDESAEVSENKELPPIIDGSSFSISDEVVDMSEHSFDVDEDNTGYYEKGDDGNVNDKAPEIKPSKPQKGNQVTIDDVLIGGGAPVPSTPKPKPKKRSPKYVPPPTDLLVCNSTDPSTFSGNAEENARILEKTLESLKFPATVSGITCGPAVTRYELEVPPGTSVRTIDRYASDIEYNLASNGKIRIETPIPGKRAVGIEVPNAEIATVALRDLIESKEFQNASSAVTLAIGKDIAAGNIICNLEKMPHLLIAGSTGSGKSACLNSIIASILYKASPEDVRLILIDPKEVEFRIYQGMPHLLIKEIINDAEQAIRAFKWAKNEMDRRYKLLSQHCVRNIQEFNACAAVKDGEEAKLPRIVIIVDELCELMMSPNRKDLEDKIMSMAQKARAAGLHLILATQRPSVDVITGTIKANLPSRIAFAVTSFNDSRTILDQGGAESLLGKGDMLYAPFDMNQPKRVQGAYITTEEVTALVNFVKEHNPCDYDDSVSDMIMTVESAQGENGNSGEDDGDEFDSLIKDVLRRVIETGNASTSMIQRRFYVGYSRASRIMDQMEMHKFIGPLEGSNKPREVYITADKFREIFGEDL